jgi:hypothetical protein
MFTIGGQKRNIDTIHRSTAHQSYCAFQIGHTGLSLLFPLE